MKKTAVIVIALIFITAAAGAGFIFLAVQGGEESTRPAPDTADVEVDHNDMSDASPAGTIPTGAADAADDPTTDTPDAPSEQNANYTIDMFNFGFSINRIEAAPGDTITIELTNSGGTHNFVIDQLGVSSDIINTGGKTLVTVTVPDSAAGKTFEYYCSVSNHRQMGMVGQLVVTE